MQSSLFPWQVLFDSRHLIIDKIFCQQGKTPRNAIMPGLASVFSTPFSLRPLQNSLSAAIGGFRLRLRRFALWAKPREILDARWGRLAGFPARVKQFTRALVSVYSPYTPSSSSSGLARNPAISETGRPALRERLASCRRNGVL